MSVDFKKIVHIISNPERLKESIRTRLYFLYYKRKFGKLGKGTTIRGRIWTSDPQNIFIEPKCVIGPYCRLESYSKYGEQALNPKMTIGANTSLQHSVHIYCANKVELGEGVLIASGCMITDNNHGMDPEGDLYLKQPLIFKSVIIEEGVWLGENVCVLGGSSIGKRSIIGSNSVVSGAIPAFCIAAGNPAKIIKRYNFESKTWEKV